MDDTSLLPFGTTIDLTNCEREPIHVPGHIQAHGCLLVHDLGADRVVQASQNAADFLGRPAEACLASSVFDLLPAPATERLRHCLAAPDGLVDRARHIFRGPLVAGGDPADVIAHRRFGWLVVEMEHCLSAGDEQVPVLELVQDGLRKLQGAVSVRSYCEQLAALVRDMTGYDRVMIYRFARDWHGWVYAESMRDGLSPFLDLHYPASDIPAQARRLFLTNRIRLLSDARGDSVGFVPPLLPDGQPLDMTHTFLRGASQMYTEYLSNMGVRGTLTMALPRREHLWGMIACHHYAEPRRISHAMRVACEVVAQTAALQLSELSTRARVSKEATLERSRNRVVAKLAESEDLVAALQGAASALHAMLPSDGMAIVTSAGVHRVGKVPSARFVSALGAFLSAQPPGSVVATHQLGADLGAASEPSDTAAGLLAVPVAHAHGAWLLWFRAEQVESVSWAGDPHKPVEVGPLGDRLTPRKSFELWVETVRGTSQPWTQAEVDSANTLRIALGDVFYRDRTRLQELTSRFERRHRELDSFNAVASHDLREPLRAIANYAGFLQEDLSGQLDEESSGHLARIQRLVRRMYSLIEGLLQFSRVGDRDMKSELVDVQALVGEIQEDLAQRIEERKATIHVAGPLPKVHTWRVGFSEILANLVSNALKFSDDPPRVEIGLSTDPTLWPTTLPEEVFVFFVRDHGIGIAPEHRENVFRVFHRLHPNNQYGEGTGTGLPIVRRLTERLGGAVWVAENPRGPGATFYFAVRDLGEGFDD